MSALYLNKRMLTQAIYMHTLVSPITLGFAFGLFGTNDPGVGNLGQRGAICFRGGAREPPAFGSVIAKLFRIRFIIIIFGINFHVEFHIVIDSFLFPENPVPWRKVPIQIFALDGTNLGQVNKKRLRPSLTLASVLEETILRPRQAQMLA